MWKDEAETLSKEREESTDWFKHALRQENISCIIREYIPTEHSQKERGSELIGLNMFSGKETSRR